ncbi:hypothetical protein CFOL_v3_34900, partial [Cephalotus follicularis]
RENNYKAQ